MPLSCPQCGNACSEQAVHCNQCGYRLIAAAVQRCPTCSNMCDKNAVACPKCGHPFQAPVARPVGPPIRQPIAQAQPTQQVVVSAPPVRKWSPGVAAVLSFFIPGLGQLYKGHLLSAMLWFVLVGVAYFFLVVPGLVLHLICIIDALSGDPYK